jgi:flagellar basal-body rod protein FlgG
MPFGSFFVSATGVQAASQFLDVSGNNVANADTVGFKTAQVSFQDLLYSAFLAAAPTPGQTPPGDTQIGSGTVLSSVNGLFTQGPLTPSTGPVDLAINGQGFFAVTLPDGTTAYTRAGNLSIDANGHIVTSEGFLLAGGITVPAGTSSVSVSPGGAVTATTPTGTVPIGNIALTQFQNPSSLTRIGNTTFAASPATGAAMTGTPGTGGLGTISQGFLEQSNVNLPTELTNLIIAQSTFQYNAQALNVENETLQATTALIP